VCVWGGVVKPCRESWPVTAGSKYRLTLLSLTLSYY